MADQKRQSMTGKVATPKGLGKDAGTVEQDSLYKAVGARIKVTAAPHNQTLEGTLFTACPITNVIAINTAPAPPNPASSLSNQPGDYHIIPVSHIVSFELTGAPQRIEGSGPGFDGALPSIGPVDIGALKAREEAAVRKLKEEEFLKGRGITKEAQEIFSALQRTLPTRWHDTQIIVNDAVVISKPYGLENCAASKKDEKSLVMVRRILQTFFERKKSAANASATAPSASRPVVATPIAPRKGG